MHALAFSDRNELKGRYCDTTRKNFSHTMVISCFSFTEICKLAAELMPKGGSLLTLTYGGSTRVVPSYNVMGVAKAALETSVRYLASDFGPQDIRVNALSAGPDADACRRRHFRCARAVQLSAQHAPMRRSPTLDEVGGAALYLLSDLSGAVTGEVHFVDCGYSTIAMPNIEALKAMDLGEKERRQPCRETAARSRPIGSSGVVTRGQRCKIAANHQSNARRKSGMAQLVLITCLLPSRIRCGETVDCQFGAG